MVKISTIKQLHLETRCRDLRAEGKTFEDVAKELSKESGTDITLDVVRRYLINDTTAKAGVIERSDKLQAKFIEAEISTITKRLDIIEHFLEIAEEARYIGNLNAAIRALQGATEAQDALDRRLGKLATPTTTNTVNILSIKEKIRDARESFRMALNAEVTEAVTEQNFEETD